MGSTALRVRFAPSPTGYLHVGGARTALFNWLLARQSGGVFVLRIEDTDRTRHVAAAEQKILDDLRWLGLDWDEGPDAGGDCGPYFQSQRLDIYQRYVEQLLEEGNAYYALDTPEELEAMRADARKAKRASTYRRPDPLPTVKEGLAARDRGQPAVVRFLMPPGDVVVHDLVRGEVRVPQDEMEDFVILKSDGWPTYHLACVVDDAMMKVTLVCRGQDHLSNAPKHVALQQALGFQTPQYAHLPLIFNLDGSKMGKRDKHVAVHEAVARLIRDGKWTIDTVGEHARIDADGASRWFGDKKAGRKPEFQALDMDGLIRLAGHAGVVLPEIDVHDFRVSGYLPEALGNFLNLLGWSPGDDREHLSRDEAVAAFSIDRIVKSNAKFDRDKLLALNTHWCAGVSPGRLLEAFRDFTQTGGSALNALDDGTASRVLEACKGLRTFRDVENKAGALFVADAQLEYDAKAVRKVLAKNDGQGYAMLERLLPALDSLATWSPDAVEALLADVCEKYDVKLGDVAQPVRVAVTGRTISPAIGDTLMLLGKERTLTRIRNCLAAVA
ncbi:MAG: glutamate--tRNA ligase [Phycisphaerales bacterium]|nr:MAG: glutamate--tRNA ligase [Phycisphaerales bacterium]